MQAKQVGVILFVLYLTANAAPFQQILTIANAVDPSSKAEFKNASYDSGWRRRIKQVAESGAQLVLWALVLKLNGLIPYPGSDRVWTAVTAVLLVSSLLAKVPLEKVFFRDELEDDDVTLAEQVVSALIQLSIDASDIVIFVLLLSMTTQKQLGTKWIHIGLLVFYALALAFVFVRDWIGPDFLPSIDYYDGPLDKQCVYDDLCDSTHRDGDVCSFCYGYATSVLAWFGVSGDTNISNQTTTTTNIVDNDELDSKNNIDYAAYSLYLRAPSAKLIYRILLVVAIVMLANQPLW